MENIPWFYQGDILDEIPEGYIGFVYRITNVLYDKKYIGKKLFKFKKTRQKNKKTRKVLEESDWLSYNGSNDELKKDIEIFGKENFKKEILYLCKTKGEANYLEAREIFRLDSLLDPLYYNGWLSVRVSRSHIKGLKKGDL
jgi:hypothetical protein